MIASLVVLPEYWFLLRPLSHVPFVVTCKWETNHLELHGQSHLAEPSNESILNLKQLLIMPVAFIPHAMILNLRLWMQKVLFWLD